MKNPIRLLLLALALASLSNSSFGAVIQFADPNFESSVRSQVEKGWIWVSGYTGNNYQFKTEDLINTSHLTLDPDHADGDFTGLADWDDFVRVHVFLRIRADHAECLADTRAAGRTWVVCQVVSNCKSVDLR